MVSRRQGGSSWKERVASSCSTTIFRRHGIHRERSGDGIIKIKFRACSGRLMGELRNWLATGVNANVVEGANGSNPWDLSFSIMCPGRGARIETTPVN